MRCWLYWHWFLSATEAAQNQIKVLFRCVCVLCVRRCYKHRIGRQEFTLFNSCQHLKNCQLFVRNNTLVCLLVKDTAVVPFLLFPSWQYMRLYFYYFVSVVWSFISWRTDKVSFWNAMKNFLRISRYYSLFKCGYFWPELFLNLFISLQTCEPRGGL